MPRRRGFGGGGGFSKRRMSSRPTAPPKAKVPARKPVPQTQAAKPQTNKQPAKKQENSKPPAQQSPNTPPQQQSSGGGGMLGNIASGIVTGMSFGAGSAVAHRAVDAVLGPRGGSDEEYVEEQQTSMQSSQVHQDPCQAYLTDFHQCLAQNDDNIASCQWFYDMVKQCKMNGTASL